VQDLADFFWGLEEGRQEVQLKMTRGFNAVYANCGE